MIDDILQHAGVKGMKWGVRRKDRNRLKQGPSDDAKTAHKALVKSKISGVEALSNKELTALNNRLNLEVTYSRLTYQPNALRKGLDTVTSLLKVGKTVDDAVAFANTPTGKKIAATLSTKTAKKAVKTTS